MAKKANEPRELRLQFDYAPAPESTAEVKLKEAYGHYIGGAFTVPTSDVFSSINPATEEVLSQVSNGSKADVDAAVQAARNALPHWSGLSGAERGKYLFKIARVIQERSRMLAVLETMDGGKPIRESRDIDLPLVAQHFFYYAGWADKLDHAFPGQKVEPIGVAAQIIPWNFPLLMAAWKLAPALAAGNTVVLKPAETTSLSVLQLAQIFTDVGLPPGVVNIVTGQGETGAMLSHQADIDKLAFTGSTEVGKILQKITAGTDTKITLELGGKAAHIIFEDAAIDQAVEGVINGIFFNQGHVCCAGSRLLVQESVYPTVMLKLRDRLKTLIVGNPLDKNTDVGAINSAAQRNTIQGYLDYAREQGYGVMQTECALPQKGYWVPPTIITDVAQSSRLVQEEIFGPVLAVQTFRTLDEAMEKANNTPYGLSAGVWTEKGAKIFEASQRLQAGVIWANTYNLFDAASPFGGYKESGFGREGGIAGLRNYVKLS